MFYSNMLHFWIRKPRIQTTKRWTVSDRDDRWRSHLPIPLDLHHSTSLQIWEIFLNNIIFLQNYINSMFFSFLRAFSRCRVLPLFWAIINVIKKEGKPARTGSPKWHFVCQKGDTRERSLSDHDWVFCKAWWGFH